MNYKEPNEVELKEILALAKKAEHQAREMCEIITAHNAKYQRWQEETQAKEKS